MEHRNWPNQDTLSNSDVGLINKTEEHHQLIKELIGHFIMISTCAS